MSEYSDLRQMIVLNQLVDRQARVHAAMLSLLDRKAAAEEPCPGWVELEEEARKQLA